MSLLKKIKLSKKLGSFIVLVFVFFPNLIFAQSNQEKINSFDIEIEVFESGDIHVKETIVYDFGLNEKRGIYREIPFKKVPGGIRGIDIKNIKVTDNINNDYKYIIDSTSPLNIKIGDPNVYITGEHTYVIDYDVKNAIGSFENFDEIHSSPGRLLSRSFPTPGSLSAGFPENGNRLSKRASEPKNIHSAISAHVRVSDLFQFVYGNWLVA